LTAEEERLSQLEAVFQHVKNVSGCPDLDEIVKKFFSRKDTNQHLKWMVDEAKSNLENLRRQNDDLDIKLKVCVLFYSGCMTYHCFARSSTSKLLVTPNLINLCPCELMSPTYKHIV